jgi:hypothetical protein
MKKSLLLIALLVGMGTAAQAQSVSLGAKGGLSIPNITPGGSTKTPLSEGYASRLDWGAGVFADFQFTKTFSLQVGLEYSGQGGQKDGMQAMPAEPIQQGIEAGLIASIPPGMGLGMDIHQLGSLLPDYFYSNFKSTAKFNYLMLPVQAKFGWSLSETSPFRFYVSAGVFGSYLMSAQRITSGQSAIFMDQSGTTMTQYMGSKGLTPPFSLIAGAFAAAFDQQTTDYTGTTTITDEIKPFNVGFIGAVGLSYEVCPGQKIFIEGGGNYGLVKIQKDDANGQNRIGSGSVMIGYSFTL